MNLHTFKNKYFVSTAILFFSQISYSGPIHDAVRAGNVGQLQQLITASPDSLIAVNEPDETTGESPLHIAAVKGDPKIVAALLSAGAILEPKIPTLVRDQELPPTMPTERLLVQLTRNAVDTRKNGLPILLTDRSKNAAFRKVIQDTLKNMESETYEGVDQDRIILNSFLRENVGIECTDCDQTVHLLTQNLLFRGADPDLEWMAHLAVKNPSYQATLARYPEAVITHSRFSIDQFMKILATGRIGLTREEVTERASSHETPKAFSTLLRGGENGPTATNGTFVQISSNQDELDQNERSGELRLILKNDILKRWDFHVSRLWPGGKFVTKRAHPEVYSQGKHSFGPGEMGRFIDFRQGEKAKLGESNELVFQNPIPISEIQEIQVAQEGVEGISNLLKHFKLDIPVRGIKSTRQTSYTAEAKEALKSSPICSTSMRTPAQDIQSAQHELQPIIDTILANPEVRAQFESFDPAIQRENLSRIYWYDKTRNKRYLDVRSSLKDMIDYQKVIGQIKMKRYEADPFRQVERDVKKEIDERGAAILESLSEEEKEDYYQSCIKEVPQLKQIPRENWMILYEYEKQTIKQKVAEYTHALGQPPLLERPSQY